MNKLVTYCLIVSLMLPCVSVIGCKPQPPPLPKTTEQPKMSPIPVPLTKPIIPCITHITKKNGTWTITLNKQASSLVKSGKAKIILNVGYCSYEATQVSGNVVKITPDWAPQGKVTAGVWITGYVSSLVYKG